MRHVEGFLVVTQQMQGQAVDHALMQFDKFVTGLLVPPVQRRISAASSLPTSLHPALADRARIGVDPTIHSPPLERPCSN